MLWLTCYIKKKPFVYLSGVNKYKYNNIYPHPTNKIPPSVVSSTDRTIVFETINIGSNPVQRSNKTNCKVRL